MKDKILTLFKTAHLKPYLCGGTARDLYMGKTPFGWDICADCTLHDLGKKFKTNLLNVDEYNHKVTLNLGERAIHVYPLKKISLLNTYYNYDYTNSLEIDSNSRDFTINGLYYDIDADKFLDFHEGKQDIANKIIRFTGDPRERILESKARLLRAPVLATILGSGWNIDYESSEAIKEMHLRLVPVNQKQINPEIINLLTRSKSPSKAFNLMRSLKILENFFPELDNCIGIEQSNKAVGLELYQHIMYAVDSIKLTSDNLLVLKLAALLHDIGKPYTKITTDTGIHFYNHENVGAYLADRIMTRWGISRNIINQVVLLIVNHLFDASPRKSDASIKKLIAKVGPGNINSLIDLRVADRLGTGRKNISMDKVEDLRKRIKVMLPAMVAESVSLNINDKELKTMIEKHTQQPAEAVKELKLYLEGKVLSGAIKNRPQSLKNAVIKVNKIACPLDKAHLFKTWRAYATDSADIFQNGFLKCGVYCKFTCNKYLKPKPRN
jgi:tRNA nucleotidyltransferase (CCA-adding enzyme)